MTHRYGVDMVRAARGSRRSRAPEHRRDDRGDERGAALILTLLVLAILVVLVVQFAFSVKVEENIVQNAQDDSALELAARGAVPWIAALLADDSANGAPSGPVDALADILFDPNTDEARTLEVGEVTLTLEAEDLDRRLPLLWLADEERKAFAEVALRRLLEKLDLPEGDPEALTQAVAERVRSLVESASDPTAPAAPAPAGGEASSLPQARGLYAIEQLLSEPAPASDDGSGEPAAPAGAGGVSRLVLYGDPEAEPPQAGLAAYVTTWPLATINLNTVLPEVLFAVIPEKDKAREPAELWPVADEIVEAVRGRRIDPAYAGGGGGEGGSAGDQGASKSWGGEAFTEVDQLQSAELHEKLAHVFTAPQEGGGEGGQPQPGQGGQTGGQAGGEEETFELKQALDVRSRLYAVRVRAQLGEGVEAIYRLVLHRNDADEVSLLLFEEAGT